MFGVFFVINIFGCNNEEMLDSAVECLDPISEAGPDITIQYGEPAILDASASSWCVDYQEDVALNWEFIAVPLDSSINTNDLSENRTNSALAPQFSPDTIGEYVLSLQINDGTVTSDTDYIVVNVVPGDNPPSADCGGSYVGGIGELITIDGTDSSDPEATELEYSWSLTVPDCSALTSENIYNQGTPKPNFVPDCSGLYVVSVVVSDGAQWSDPAICSIEVSPENQTPVADAGVPLSYGGCASNPVRLNGFSSFDADGDDLDFTWSLVSAPSDSNASDSNFNDVHAKAPEFTWDVAGEYIAQLQVYDGTTWSSPDLVSIQIGDASNNAVPQALVQSDLTVALTTTCMNTSNGSSTVQVCNMCSAYNVVLDGSASVDPDFGDELSYLWSNSGSCYFPSPIVGKNHSAEDYPSEQACIASQGEWVVLAVDSPNSAVTSTQIPPMAPTNSSDPMVFEMNLNVSDCQGSSSNIIKVSYTCTAE